MNRYDIKTKHQTPNTKQIPNIKVQATSSELLEFWLLKSVICLAFVSWCLVFSSNLVLADELRDVKPPVDFLPNYLWLYLVLAALLAGLIFAVYRLLTSRPKQPPVKPKTAPEIALERLERLKAANLPAKGMIKEYFAELSDIVRQYIEGRFQIRAPEMTTDEFLHSLRTSKEFKEEDKKSLNNFLNSSDLVKFAKYKPADDEMDKSYLFAVKFINDTKPAPS